MARPVGEGSGSPGGMWGLSFGDSFRSSRWGVREATPASHDRQRWRRQLVGPGISSVPGTVRTGAPIMAEPAGPQALHEGSHGFPDSQTVPP